jgi:hypothetical protein
LLHPNRFSKKPCNRTPCPLRSDQPAQKDSNQPPQTTAEHYSKLMSPGAAKSLTSAPVALKISCAS